MNIRKWYSEPYFNGYPQNRFLLLKCKQQFNSAETQSHWLLNQNKILVLLFFRFTSLQDIERAVGGISPSLRSSEVDASKALALARQMFEDGYEHHRQGTPRALIFVTDSESNLDFESVLSQRDLVRGEGIQTFGIGIGRQTIEELQLLSWGPDNTITVPDYRGLRRSTNEVRRKIYACKFIYCWKLWMT